MKVKRLLLLGMVTLGAFALSGCKLVVKEQVTFTEDKVLVKCQNAIDGAWLDETYKNDPNGKKTFLETFGYDVNNTQWYNGEKYYVGEGTGFGDTYQEVYETTKRMQKISEESDPYTAFEIVKEQDFNSDGSLRFQSTFTKDVVKFKPSWYLSEIDKNSDDPKVVTYNATEIKFTTTKPWVYTKGGTLSADGKTITFSFDSDMSGNDLKEDCYAYTADGYCKEFGHKTSIANKKAATYFAKGYSGDTVCTTCGKVITKGKEIKQKVLGKPSIKATTKKTSITVKWAKVKDAKGYEVQIKKGSKWTSYKVTKAKKTIKKLKANKKYKVRVRALIKEGKAIAYSKWKTKTVKTKK